MKLLVVLLFVGLASASSPDAFKAASNDVVENFIYGMSQAPPLHLALGVQETEEIKRFESDIKEELAKYLRELFDDALKKIKNAIDNGVVVHKETFEKLKDLKEKMKELNISEDDVAGKLLEDLKAKVKGHFKELLDKMGIYDKRSINFGELMEADESIFEDLNIRNFIIKMKEMILNKMDVDSLKASVAKLVGKGAQKLCEWLTDKGKEKVINFFDRILEKDEDKKKRSVSDLYQQIKDYFEDLDLDIKQKFFKFGEWVKDVIEKGLDKSKSKVQNVKVIARQLLERSKGISKEVAIQALEYLKEYKEELGELYDKVRNKLMEKIGEYTD